VNKYIGSLKSGLASNQIAVLGYLPGLLVFLCFLLRVLAELRSGLWEPDLDYLMYVADQWLSGSPPWINEFDDKLPFTYLFFLLPALVGSIRIFQVESMLLILAGSASIAYLAISRIAVHGPFRPVLIGQIGWFSFSLFSYGLAFCGSSINAINGLSASLFSMAAAILLFAFAPPRSNNTRTTLALMLAALIAAASVSLRPYYLLAAQVLIVWVFLASKKLELIRLLKAIVAWNLLLFIAGMLLNAFPYLLTGNLEAFLAGISLLSQNLIPAYLPEVLKRQFYSFLALPDLVFLAFGSGFVLLFLGFVLKSLAPSLQCFHLKYYANRYLLVDVFFWSFLFGSLMQILILKKHFYPHYWQLFVPFGVLSLAWFLASLCSAFDQLSRPLRLTSVMCSLLLLLALLRTDFVFSARDFFFPVLDSRTAEFVVFSQNSLLQNRLSRGFLYPESMSLHWKFHSSRFGFPNTYSFQLINEGAWESLKMPGYFNLPITPKALCDRLRIKGPSIIITKTPWISECLDDDPAKTYILVEQVDHSLLRLAARNQSLPSYKLSLYERLLSDEKGSGRIESPQVE